MLVFYCGGSCIACVVHLFKLRRLLQRRRDIDVLAVGSNGRESARSLLAVLGDDIDGRDIVLLDDPARAAAARCGLLDRGVPVPAAFILDRGDLVRCSFVDEGHRRRPSVDVVRRALDAAEGEFQE